MNLKDLFAKASIPYTFQEDVLFTRLIDDSRDVQPGDVFMAWSENYIENAKKRGAVAILGPNELNRDQQIKLIRAFFDPLPRYLMAVTGTNGKTSVTHFAQQLLNKMGIKSAALGTLGVIPDVPAITQPNLTTMPLLWVYRTLNQLAQFGFEAVAMEASSHGLDQGRLQGLPFSSVALTNITHDHLDYHHTLEAYRTAKKRLFTEWPQATATLPEHETNFAPHATYIYGGEGCDIAVRDVHPIPEGLTFELVGYGRHRVPLAGQFQLNNVLAAIGLLLGIDIEIEDILPHLRTLQPVPGRLEKIGHHKQASVYVDFAHTPDGLQTVLEAIKPHTIGKIHVVFGCGGDRDTTKRPIMGAVAQQYADNIIITNDNPRTEDPQFIAQAITTKCPKGCIILDRHEALQTALTNLQSGDSLIVAGKGDERNQEINGTKYPFHDKSILLDLMKKMA